MIPAQEISEIQPANYFIMLSDEFWSGNKSVSASTDTHMYLHSFIPWEGKICNLGKQLTNFVKR